MRSAWEVLVRDEGQTDREALLGVHPQSGPVPPALGDGEREKRIRLHCFTKTAK